MCRTFSPSLANEAVGGLLALDILQPYPFDLGQMKGMPRQNPTACRQLSMSNSRVPIASDPNAKATGIRWWSERGESDEPVFEFGCELLEADADAVL